MSLANAYVLYGADESGAAAIEIALARTGAPWRLVEAPPWSEDPALPALAELAALNPLRQVPTLQVPDGSVLSESAAILIHLGLAFPASGLLPAEEPARSQSIRGLVFIAANCYSAIGLIDHPQRWCGPLSRAEQARVGTGARAHLHRQWEHFADLFPPSGEWLAGERPGALDLLALVVSRWSGTREHLAGRRPALHALLERLARQPEVAPVLQRHAMG